MAEAVRQRYDESSKRSPFTVLISAVAEYQGVKPERLDRVVPTFETLEVSEGIDINAFVRTVPEGEISFTWGEMAVTVMADGTVTVSSIDAYELGGDQSQLRAA
jgi:hypothetical protein